MNCGGMIPLGGVCLGSLSASSVLIPCRVLHRSALRETGHSKCLCSSACVPVTPNAARSHLSRIVLLPRASPARMAGFVTGLPLRLSAAFFRPSRNARLCRPSTNWMSSPSSSIIRRNRVWPMPMNCAVNVMLCPLLAYFLARSISHLMTYLPSTSVRAPV